MAKYHLTPAAKNDLRQMWNYTAKYWSAKQAEQYLLAIETKLELLAANPELGRHREEISPTYYYFPAEKYIVFYLKAKEHIEIIGILHKRMDVVTNLN